MCTSKQRPTEEYGSRMHCDARGLQRVQTSYLPVQQCPCPLVVTKSKTKSSLTTKLRRFDVVNLLWFDLPLKESSGPLKGCCCISGGRFLADDTDIPY